MVDELLKEKKDELEAIIRRSTCEHFGFLKREGICDNHFNLGLISQITLSNKTDESDMKLYIKLYETDTRKCMVDLGNKLVNIEKMIKRAFNLPDKVTKIKFEKLLNEFKKRYDIACYGVVSYYKSLNLDSFFVRSSDIFIYSSLMFLADSIIDGNNIEFNIVDYMNKKENADQINIIYIEKENENGKHN